MDKTHEGRYKKSFSTYKKEAIRVARELYYPQKVINKLNAAKTEIEIDNILAVARKES